MHQAAGRIVDIDQCRARWGAILEPTMLATVDLHEFAKTRASQSWLVNLRWPQLAWNPQTYGDLQPADSLFGERDVMLGSELLGRQGRPKIRVRGLEEFDHAVRHGVLEAIIARPVESLGDQPNRTLSRVAARQAPHLPGGQPESLGGAPGLQIAVDDGLDTLQLVEIAHRECHPGVLPHGEPPDPGKGPRN
jgi:hypothetical protein